MILREFRIFVTNINILSRDEKVWIPLKVKEQFMGPPIQTTHGHACFSNIISLSAMHKLERFVFVWMSDASADIPYYRHYSTEQLLSNLLNE